MSDRLFLNDIVDRAYSIAKDNGWHDEPERSFGEEVALCHSELSEALEEYRRGWYPEQSYSGVGGKPEGVPAELADAVIRIADMCGRYGIDLERAVEAKMAYNKTRPHRHGGKKL